MSRMVTLKLGASESDLAAVKARYRLHGSDIDDAFGLVAVSPEQSLYAVLLSDQAADRIEGAKGVAGVHSNPRIEPFGPPR